MELQSGSSNNGENANPPFFEDIDNSTCSTPYVSAPSSPGRGGPIAGGFFYSAPASPMHFAMTTSFTHSSSSYSFEKKASSSSSSSSEFEFSARFGSTGLEGPGSMSSAEELFLNGQIRPMKLSTHLERPQVLAPLLDLEEEEEETESRVRGRDLRLRDKSERRRARSLSPMRNTPLEWTENEDLVSRNVNKNGSEEEEGEGEEGNNTNPNSVSASSSGGIRSSKRWVFLKDFLRSKSEGRSNNKFWSTISFSSLKNQNHGNGSSSSKGNSQTFSSRKVGSGKGKATNGVVGKRASPHELHYKANRAQAEELRKKTFLPYRQGLLIGCLGFSSKGTTYGAIKWLC